MCLQSRENYVTIPNYQGTFTAPLCYQAYTGDSALFSRSLSPAQYIVYRMLDMRQLIEKVSSDTLRLLLYFHGRFTCLLIGF